MSDQLPSFPSRLGIAFSAFFRALSDPEFAQRLAEARDNNYELPAPSAPAALPPAKVEAAAPKKEKEAPKKETPKSVPPPAAQGATAPEGALHLLALFQREGRLLDFCEEELSGFSDAAVGAAARMVHQGVRKVLHQNLKLEPVRTEKEGAQITLQAGFDSRAVRLTGNVTGAPPFTGALKHHGWRVSEVKLPQPPRGDQAQLIAPAEVELP